MNKKSMVLSNLIISFLFLPLIAFSQISSDTAFIDGTEARIKNFRNQTQITLSVTQPEKFRVDNNELMISVEIPNAFGDLDSSAKVFSSALKVDDKTLPKAAVGVKRVKIDNVTMPPGPDNSTTWHSFSIDLASAYNSGPLAVSIDLKSKRRINFTRVLIGNASTNRSKVLGAFPLQRLVSKKRLAIPPGLDYLGTVTAKQRLRIPANKLAPDTEAFDEMVDFGDNPFEPSKNNIDTVMLRTRKISVGETTPVRLLRFANKSKKPIRIKGKKSDHFYMISARLSPNAESGGFVTIRNDGTYQSTTSLTPILEFQKVSENGKSIGQAITVDTATTPIAGFPFYLSSDGGKWTNRAPKGRLTNTETKNFFYNNGIANSFFHSNGPGPGVLAKCSKASTVLVLN